MIPSQIRWSVYGRGVSTSHSNSEQRPTCKMTPEQLLGLQQTARAKTATLSPEISIIDPDAAPNVIVAEGTQESIPILVDDLLDEVISALPETRLPVEQRPSPLGAVIGFALFAAVTAAEILVVVLS
jgi:hypothetical protein